MRTESDLTEHDGGTVRWWQREVFYQIYPLSFLDTNGDGIGDLEGIIRRLDYLRWLGIGAVWVSPIYPSPMADFGYDVSDFTGVHPVFGTQEDFDRLVAEMHARDMKLILDFVPNHTSAQHPWFLESRASRDNPRRDWYIWRDPAPDGGPPNNWLSRFGGSGWTFDAWTGQYYYHAFLEQQPDLNWRNPEVRQAMHDILRHWMRQGVDGFRVDAAAVLAEDDRFRDDPPNPDFKEGVPPPERFKRVHTNDVPVTLQYLAEMRDVIEEFPDRVLLGEVEATDERIADFYGGDGKRLHLPLNYRLLDEDWSARSISAMIDKYYEALPLPAWPCWVMGSHDKHRIASRVGADQARVAAMLMMTLRGTPIFYAGDEIGMDSIPISAKDARDPFEKFVPGYGLNRDPHRVPMRWDPGPNAGFTTGTPWIRVGEGVERINVATMRDDPSSILHLYRRLIALRREEPVLLDGVYEPSPDEGDVLIFHRRLGNRTMLVALNFGGASWEVRLDASGRLRLSTALDRENEPVAERLRLRPHEGVVVDLDAS